MVCKRKGDLRKCVPIYAVGAVLIFCGLPLMITGIAGQFNGADLVGYVGGICIFFGLGFFLMWHMFTIENVEKNLPALEYDPTLNNIQDVVEKSKVRERNRSSSASHKEITGFTNLAFDSNKDLDGKVSRDNAANDISSETTRTVPTNVDKTHNCDSESPVKSDSDTEAKTQASSTNGERYDSSKNNTTLTTLANDFSATSRTSSRNSIPLEVV